MSRSLKSILLVAGILMAFLMALFVDALVLKSHSVNIGKEYPFVAVTVVPGDSASAIIAKMQQAGLKEKTTLLKYALWRAHVPANAIHTGYYRIERGATLTSLWKSFQEGPLIDQVYRLPEGATVKEILASLRQEVFITDVDDSVLLKAFKVKSIDALEGQFAPDTYHFSRGETITTLLFEARKEQERRLERAWKAKSERVVFNNKKELLTLASIIEKEAGTLEDMGKISAVFRNRLKLGIPLQSDPTVIYAMGLCYEGNIRKVDLKKKHPYNTYQVRGLPPGPISAPSVSSLMAAAQPEAVKYLYFVAEKGSTGRSVFSKTLDEHNRAVRKHILLRH